MSECYSFVVNGVPCSTEEEKPLLRYLRDELRLTSVKDGCSEGACGTCTILVDGKAVKACVLSTKRAAGKEIVTVEGLSEAEREAFVYAFGAVGAVQCGFCIPGMVMAGKALLDQGVIAGEDSSYGLYVKTVNGITLDYDTDGMYWAFYINGEYAQTGVDATGVENGAVYAFRAEK